MANKAVTLRFGTEGADVVRRDFVSIGKEGEASLRRLQNAGNVSSRGLQALNTAVLEGRGTMETFAERAGAGGRVLAAFGPAGLAMAAGVGIGIASLGALSVAVGAAMEAMDNLADQAEKLGVSTDFMQAFTYAGEQMGVNAETAGAAIGKLSQNLGDISRGEGKAAVKALEDLGISAFDAEGKIKTVEQILPEIADGFARLGNSAEKSSLAVDLVGRGNAQMITFLNAGSQAMRDQMQVARETGAVLDKDMVARLAQMNDQLSAAQRVSQNGLYMALAGLAPYLVKTAELFADIAIATGRAVDGMQDVEKQAAMTIASTRDNLVTSIQNQKDAIANVERSIEAAAKLGAPTVVIEGILEGERAKLVQLNEQLRIYNEEMMKRQPITGMRSGAADVPVQTPEDKKALADQAAAVAKVTEELAFQEAQLRRTEVQQRIEIELRKAGVTAASAEGQQIAALTTRIVEAEQRRKAKLETTKLDTKATQDNTAEIIRNAESLQREGEALTERMMTDKERLVFEQERLNLLLNTGAISQTTYSRAMQETNERLTSMGKLTVELKSSAANLFGQFASGAMKGKEAVRQLMAKLIELAASKAFNSIFENSGGFNLGSLFKFADGGVMGSGGARALPVQAFAAGGIANRPMVSVFGEARRPEAYVPLQDGRTIPVTVRGGGGGPQTVRELNVYQTFEAGVAPAQLEAAMDNVKQATLEAMREDQRRGRG